MVQPGSGGDEDVSEKLEGVTKTPCPYTKWYLFDPAMRI